jgi:hypothetical protein
MSTTIVRLATCAALLGSAAVALAQNVTPPPLPPGSDRVRPEAGLQEVERKRYTRAHHHKMAHRRAPTAGNGGGAAQHPAPKK